MSNSQDLPVQLAKAYKQLHTVQSHIAALASQLFEEMPHLAALVGSEDRYHRTLDTMLEGCQIIGFDWKYLYINETAARHSQRKKEELIGHAMTERYPGIDKTPMFAVLQRCMQERSVERIENEFVYPNGTSAWFELSVQPVPEGIFILSLDITERKLAEETLRRSEIRFRTLVEAVEDYAIYLLDKDGYVASWNTGAERLKGYKSDEIIGQHFSHFFTTEDQQNAKPQSLLDTVVAEGRTEDEGWRVRKDGSRFWADVVITALRNTDDSLYGFAKITRDLTQGKQTQERIRKLHRTLAVLSDINQCIVRTRHLPSLFEKACEIAVEKGDFRMAWIGLFDSKAERLAPASKAGIANSDFEKLTSALNTESLIGLLRAGERLVSNDIQNDPRCLSWHGEASRLGYCAMVALPLIVAGEIRGSFNLYAGETAFFDEQEMRLMDEMAVDISFAIEFTEQDAQRQMAEAALRNSEEKYRSLIESSESVIAVFDMEGTYLYANQIAAMGLSLTPETILGRKLHEVFPSPSAERQLERIQQVIQTKEGRVYEAATIVLGEERWYRTSIQPIRDTSGEVTSAVVNAVDITRIKQAESDLRNERDNLEQTVAERTADLQAALVRVEAILNNSPDGILLAHPDLSIQQANPSFDHLFGIEHGEYSGKSLLTLLQPDDATLVSGVLQSDPDQRNGRRLDVCAIRKDGSTFDAELNIGVIKGDGLVCIMRDITERKAQDRQLRYQAALQANVSDAVIVTDLDLRIQSWNEAAARIYGWNSDDAIGKVASELLQIRFASDRDLEADFQQLNERGFIQQETIQRHKTGADIFILGSATLLADENGVPTGIIAVNRDITERKAQERQLRYHASIQESVSDAVIATDTDFRIKSWNRTAELVYGWSAAEAIGKLVSEVLPTSYETEEDGKRIRQDFLENGAWQGEVIQRHHDGSTIHIHASVNLFKDETGQPIGVVSVNRNITERKHAAEALQKSAAEIHDLYNNAPCGYHSIDKDGLVIQINDTELRWLGYTRDEVIGKLKVAALLTPQSLLVFQKTFPVFMEQRQIHDLELDMVRKDGSIMHILLNASAIYDDAGQYLRSRSTLFDITELQKAQQAVTDRETRYRLLAENISDVIAKSNPDGIHTFITPSCYALLGYEPDELIGRPGIDFIHPDDRADTLTAVMQAVSEGRTTFSFARRFVHKAGHDIWVEVTNNILYDSDTGKPVEIIGVMRDITGRKKAEAELREAEHRYHALFEQSHDGVFLVDMQGNYLEINQRACEMLGYSVDELRTLSFRELSDEVPQTESVMQQLLDGETISMYERVLRNKDGSRISTEINTEIVRDLDGNPLHIQTVVRDITERKRVEQSLRESEERFRRAIIDAPFPIMIHAEGGEVLHISNVWAELSGYTQTDIPTVADWVEKAYRENARSVGPVIDNVYSLTGTRRSGEFTIWTKSGEERIWDFISAPLAVMPDGRRMISSMAMDITKRKRAEETLQNKIEEEHQFQGYLKALHEIVIELTAIEKLDAFCKRAVELGRERLGFERLALFLYEEQDGSAIGTFGTDIHGNLTDERGVRFIPDPNGIMQRSFEHAERFYFNEQTTLHSAEAPVGRGWNAAAVLWNGNRSLGWFVADNLLSQTPASKSLLDIIGLYALSVGTLLAQKQIQAALRDRESLYRLLAENISDLITRSTLTSECLYISPSVQPILGYTDEDLIGQRIFDLVHPDDQTTIWEAYASALERHDLILPHQYRARHKYGHYIWLETVGKPLFKDGTNEISEVVTSSRDITERKRAEEALRQSQQMLFNVLEHIPIRIFWKDRNSVYRGCNTRHAQAFALMSPDEIVGKTDYDLFPDRAAEWEAADVDVMISGIPHLNIEELYTDADGSSRWLRSNKVPLRSADREVSGVLVTIEDITARKHAEDALRESEERFRLLLDAAPVATVISNDTGHITLVNIQAETLFGYNRAELIGQPIETLVPAHVREKHVHNRADYISMPRVRPMGLGMALFAKRKDSSEFPVEIELSHIESATGLLVMSFVVDITERKRVAEELERQRSFLRSVIDVSPSMIFVKDYDGRFVLVNPLVATLYGTTVENMIGKTDADFNPSAQEIINFLDADRHVITSGERLDIEEPITNLAGKIYWMQTTKVPIISDNGRTKYVLGVSTDITERRRAEDALRESEEKYRSLVETMRGGLVVFDLNGKITFINDRFCEILGYSRDHILGTSAADYVDQTHLPLLAAQLERRRHAESSTYELLFRHKNGSPVHLLVSGSPLFGKNGEYNGSFAVTTDITLQKQAEQRLQWALEQEKELGELKTRFVSMASHEFRTPLATILALTETLSNYRKRLTDEQIDQRLQKVREQISHLNDIMEDVLQLARLQARRAEFNPSVINLDVLCRGIIEEFKEQRGMKHTLKYVCDAPIPDARLDKKQMRRIISNLLSNAIKYSPEGKNVTLELQHIGQSLVLSVRDEGIGIPDVDLKHMFEPFHRAENVGTIPGTGLGLVITRESVELHGGRIEVESQLDIGTTFTITIPLNDGENEGN